MMSHNDPTALGIPAIIQYYVDYNLYHDTTTEHSVTGVFHFINQACIDFSLENKQLPRQLPTYLNSYQYVQLWNI